MSVKLLTEHHLGFLNLKGGCTGSPESTLFKMPHCWESHVTTHMKGVLKSWPGIHRHSLSFVFSYFQTQVGLDERKPIFHAV